MPGFNSLMLAAGEAHGPELIDPNFAMFVLTIVTFLLLLVALKFTAWPAIIKALDEREKRIQQRFTDAEERVDAAERKVDEYEQRIRNIEDEGRTIIDEARSDAEGTRSRIQAAAREEIERMIARARREIDLAQAKAAEDLKTDVVDMAVQIVEKVLEEQVEEAEHRRFVDDCITKYENMKL